jgi:2-aminoadipate transaminase
MNYQALLAPRTAAMGSNAIREILKVVARPGMISLAGGVPAPESLPVALFAELTHAVVARHGAGAFQYDLTEGFGPLREALAGYLGGKGIRTTAAAILTASGSQGVLDALGKALIAPGDAVALEAPTYLGALQAFAPYGPRYVELATDEDGLRPESLAVALDREKIKLIYLVPNFQNPTGRTIPLARRRAIAGMLQASGTLLVEDDPYGDLRYEGAPLPPIQTLAPEHVVYVGTLSKICAPGLRVGFCVAPEPLRPWLVRIKQGVDLHTGTFSQALAAEYLAGGHLPRQLQRILALYRPRRDALLEALGRHLPAGFHWSTPLGGMFVWVEGPPGLDAEKAYRRAVERGTAFVPGKYFFPLPGRGAATLRLNFTGADPAGIRRAVGILGEVLEGEGNVRPAPAQPTTVRRASAESARCPGAR